MDSSLEMDDLAAGSDHGGDRLQAAHTPVHHPIEIAGYLQPGEGSPRLHVHDIHAQKAPQGELRTVVRIHETDRSKPPVPA